MRINDLKNKYWVKECLLERPNIIENEVRDLEIKIIKLIYMVNLKSCKHEHSNLHEMKGGIITIEDIIGRKINKKSLTSMKRTEVMFITQIIKDNKLLTWKEICNKQNRSS